MSSSGYIDIFKGTSNPPEKFSSKGRGAIICYIGGPFEQNKLPPKLREFIPLQLRQSQKIPQKFGYDDLIVLESHDPTLCLALAEKIFSLTREKEPNNNFYFIGNSTLFHTLHNTDILSHLGENILELIPYYENHDYLKPEHRISGKGWTAKGVFQVFNAASDKLDKSTYKAAEQAAANTWNDVDSVLNYISRGGAAEAEKKSFLRWLEAFIPAHRRLPPANILPEVCRYVSDIPSIMKMDLTLLLEGILVLSKNPNDQQFVYHLPSLAMAHQTARHIPGGRYPNISSLEIFCQNYETETFPFD